MRFAKINFLKKTWLKRLKEKEKNKTCVYYTQDKKKRLLIYQGLNGIEKIEKDIFDPVLIPQHSSFTSKSSCYYLSNENKIIKFNEIEEKYAKHLSVINFL